MSMADTTWIASAGPGRERRGGGKLELTGLTSSSNPETDSFMTPIMAMTLFR